MSKLTRYILDSAALASMIFIPIIFIMLFSVDRPPPKEEPLNHMLDAPYDIHMLEEILLKLDNIENRCIDE